MLDFSCMCDFCINRLIHVSFISLVFNIKSLPTTFSATLHLMAAVGSAVLYLLDEIYHVKYERGLSAWRWRFASPVCGELSGGGPPNVAGS